MSSKVIPLNNECFLGKILPFDLNIWHLQQRIKLYKGKLARTPAMIFNVVKSVKMRLNKLVAYGVSKFILKFNSNAFTA